MKKRGGQRKQTKGKATVENSVRTVGGGRKKETQGGAKTRSGRDGRSESDAASVRSKGRNAKVEGKSVSGRHSQKGTGSRPKGDAYTIGGGLYRWYFV